MESGLGPGGLGGQPPDPSELAFQVAAQYLPEACHFPLAVFV
jgi:hypothetical protein